MINSTKLVPDLQHYMNKLVNRAQLNKDLYLAPIDVDEIFLDENKSFIRLLFSNDWPMYYTTYRYLFQLVPRTAYPYVVLTRLMIYPSSDQYYLANSDDPSVCTVNVFTLQSDDLLMLDALLEYRLSDSTADVIISIDFNSLTTRLSQLIYIYLDLQINHNYSLYDDTTVISNPDNVLENCYEYFLIESIFDYISNFGT